MSAPHYESTSEMPDEELVRRAAWYLDQAEENREKSGIVQNVAATISTAYSLLVLARR